MIGISPDSFSPLDDVNSRLEDKLAEAQGLDDDSATELQDTLRTASEAVSQREAALRTLRQAAGSAIVNHGLIRSPLAV